MQVTEEETKGAFNDRRIRSDVMRGFYAAWDASSAGRPAPARSDFLPETLVTWWPDMFLVDVAIEAGRPVFAHRLFGSCLENRLGRKLGGHALDSQTYMEVGDPRLGGGGRERAYQTRSGTIAPAHHYLRLKNDGEAPSGIRTPAAAPLERRTDGRPTAGRGAIPEPADQQGLLMSDRIPEEIDLEADDLAEILDRLGEAERNRLPFGLVLMSHSGEVLYYSDREREMSGYPRDPVGLNWLRDVAPCMNEEWIVEGLARCRDCWRLDFMVRTTGDHRDRRQELDLRLLSAVNGQRMWLLIRRI